MAYEGETRIRATQKIYMMETNCAVQINLKTESFPFLLKKSFIF